MKDEEGEGGKGGKIYLLAEATEKGLDGSLSKRADRDGAFPFCAAIDTRSRTHFMSRSWTVRSGGEERCYGEVLDVIERG